MPVIYALVDLASSEPFYVGRTSSLNGRLRTHKKRFEREFTHIVLETLDGIAEALAAERRWIEHYFKVGAQLVNRRVTASGATIVSEETRAKLSKSLTGRGRSEEYRRHISEAKLGHKMSDEFRAKRSAIMKARYADPEERRKTAEKSRGRVHSPEVKARISLSARARLRGADGRWV